MRLISKIVLLPFLVVYYKFTRGIKISFFTILSKKTRFEGNNKVCRGSFVSDSVLGYGSYVGANCFLSKVNIGRFCSIGSNVKVISSMHPTSKFVSTHPSFYSNAKQAGFTYVNQNIFEEHVYADANRSFAVEIESDVWIGSDVTILGGCRIGNGAVIATGAVVTKDVESYQIVGGVPAKEVKKRFTDEDIKFLLDLRWWEKDLSWISENAAYFKDLELLKAKFSK